MDATASGLIVLTIAMTLYQIVIVWAAFNGKLMQWAETDKAQPVETPAASTKVAVLQPERVDTCKIATLQMQREAKTTTLRL